MMYNLNKVIIVEPAVYNQESDNTKNTTNGLAVAGFVLAFFIPLVGLVLSIVGLSQTKKRKQKGEGLAIAGIVISSVACLSWLVLIPLIFTSFNGIQQKARDTERETDIKAIHAQVEAFWAQTGYYPSLTNMNDLGASGFVETNLHGLDKAAFLDPKGTSTTLVTTPAANVYAYAVTNNKGKSCEADVTKCSTYMLTATLEGTLNGSGTYSKSSLNN